MGENFGDMEKKRCAWCNEKNEIYVQYHDHEWGHLRTDDMYLFEMLLLESFQAGLSWECVLNKREAFRRAYDNFDYRIVSTYEEEKIQELMQDPDLIRNRLKIQASIQNAKVFRSIVEEFGSFYKYIEEFTKGKFYHEVNQTRSWISDAISKDLKKRGMKFVGTTTLYAYLQAIGIVQSHEKECFLYQEAIEIRKE